MEHGHKKKKLRKYFFHIILKCLKTKHKEYKRRKVWDKALFQEKENKSVFHQKLQNIRVSDRFMITQGRLKLRG